MHRGTQDRKQPRRNAERDASQPTAGQPRSDDAEDALQNPAEIPSRLTARELQAKDPAKPGDGDKTAGERHASASSSGSKGEPIVSDKDPPRGDRGLPRHTDIPRKTPGGKSK